MFQGQWLRALPALAVVLLFSTAANAGLIGADSIGTVIVGDLNNPAGSTGYGSVPYLYAISTTEVTVQQYVDFLNAVAAKDKHHLYNSHKDAFQTIVRTGKNGQYQYSAATGRGDMPIARVSWYDAARFVNWLNNGSPVGPQNDATTEDGVYDVSLGKKAVRKAGALWALPTADEWYKAAYYDPNNKDNNGYWLYPTQSDVAPVSVDPAVAGENSANYKTKGYSSNYYAPVGSFPDSASFYGTLDQAGNVGEWIEGGYKSKRGIRGGAYDSSAASMAYTYEGLSSPGSEYRDVGFRVVFLAPEVSNPVPEPATILALAAGGLLMAGRGARRMRRRRV